MAPSVDSLELSVDWIDAMIPEGGVCVVIYHAFFDESGTHDGSPLMTIATYVFIKRSVRLFSEQWFKKLKAFGISHAHMTDCATGNGEYKKLTMDKRKATVVELIAQIKKHSLSGAAICLDANHYNEAMKNGTHVYGPYTCLLLQAVDRVSRYVAGRDSNAKISYFFENGHRSSTEAHRFMNSIKQYGGQVGDNYGDHTFVDKKTFLPLQAADMLAWQFRHFTLRSAQGYKPRKDFLALIREVDFYSEFDKRKVEWIAGLIRQVDPLKTSGPFDLLARINQHLIANGLPI